VYSLGATLYCLLTGKPPLSDPDTEVVLRRVRAGDIPPPRAVNASVHPALDAVCRKAMALRPDDRYDSPAALAQEIKHWLADEPVSAFPDGFSRRLARWSRRHRARTQAAAAATLAIAVVATAAALAIERARRGEQAARADAVANLAESEANFALARDAVDRFYTRVSQDTLLNEPHMGRLRKELLGSAREFYEKFVARRQADAAVRSLLGSSHLRLADIAADGGHTAEAISHDEQARAIFEALAAARPDDPQPRADLAIALNNLALAYQSAGRNLDAEATHRLALAGRERLAVEHPERHVLRSAVASSHQNLGALYSDLGRFDEADASHAKALAIRERLAAEYPAVADYRHDLAQSCNNLAINALAQGRVAVAERLYDRARQGWESLARDQPEVAAHRKAIAVNLIDSANLYTNGGRRADAERSYRTALADLEALVASYPEHADYRRILVVCRINFTDLLNGSSRWDEAERLTRQALAECDRLVALRPTADEDLLNLSRSHHSLGIIQDETGRTGDAEAEFLAAQRLAEGLAAAHAEVAVYRCQVARTSTSLGLLYTRLNRPAEAERSLLRAIALAEVLTAANPDADEYRRLLANGQNNLAHLCDARDRPADATAWALKARAHTERLARDSAPDSAARRELANLDNLLGGIYRRNRQWEAAEAAFLRGVESQRAALEGHPDRIDLTVDLGGSYCNLGSLASDRNDSTGALAWFDRAEAILAEAHRRAPQFARAREFLRNTHYNRVDPLRALGRHAEVVTELEQALALDSGAMRLDLRFLLASARARAGDHARAVAEADALSALGSIPAGPRDYNVACIESCASAAVRDDERLPAPERRALAERLALRALAHLGSSRAAGFLRGPNAVAVVTGDRDLDALRSRREFALLVMDLAMPEEPFAGVLMVGP
jgi:tetratricopeptide (TPR) repeat protein